MPASPHILFAGGGAPSQLHAGLSIAQQLEHKIPDTAITFSGPGSAEARHQVVAAGYEYLTIPARPAPSGPLQALRFVTDNLAGYCSARWMLRERKVSLVVGLGGYGSLPMVKAAACRGTPIVLLEEDVVPGKTVRWLGQRSATVCVAFEQTKPHLPVQTEVHYAGSPVHAGFEQLFHSRRCGSASHEVGQTKKRLVVLGGAQGSTALNMVVPGALRQLGPVLDDWQIIHQTGEGQLQETERRYQKSKVDALAVTYIDELAAVLFDSDLVICRSGGTTLAELALAGVPSLLVPRDEGTGGSQLANAKVYCAAGASRMVEEESQIGLFQSALTRELKQLMTCEHLRKQMRAKLVELARPHASADIATTICAALYGESAPKPLAA